PPGCGGALEVDVSDALPAALPAALIDLEPRRRLAAIDRAGNGAAARYALRGLLLRDPDARVRARAAQRLGRAGEPRLTGALLEAAAFDARPMVREAAWRSLSRAPR